jgi:hypothetical protein
MDQESRKKLQIFLLLGILLAGGRAAYVVYSRYQDRKEAEKPKQEKALKDDYYVTPKKLHPYDLKSARELTKQPVWVRVGYAATYYPYNPARHKTDFDHEAGTLGPLQKLQITDVVSELPHSKDARQVLAIFALEGKGYAVPIGAEASGDYKIYSDEMFFIEDPHELYKHWASDVWKSVDAHEIRPGMSELQASFARGLASPQGSGDYGSRTLLFTKGGTPLTVTFRADKAVDIKQGPAS